MFKTFSIVNLYRHSQVEKGYKLKDTFATKTPTPKQKDAAYRVRPSQSSPVGGSIDLVGEAAIAAAYKIAEAEAKSFLASEAVKEAERVSKMAEETESLLMLAREIFEQCSRDVEQLASGGWTNSWLLPFICARSGRIHLCGGMINVVVR
ncbi:hypothetical protein Taro_023804 [Colocasia esculenta]|uniref:Uncharacterized protein n=1 Tax=Colocasia esculenta TaxID=4460 RepID=A0A843V5M4_COLES|nr:hypothetical protein [Colocasia esculenta]